MCLENSSFVLNLRKPRKIYFRLLRNMISVYLGYKTRLTYFNGALHRSDEISASN